MSKILSFVKNISLIAVLIVLSMAYADVSRNEKVHLYFNLYDVSELSVDRDTFFYVPVGFILLLNLLLVILVKIIKQSPINILPVGHKSFWLANEESQFHCREMFMSWLLSLGFWVNIIWIFFIVRVWKMNRSMKGMEDQYASLFYGSAIVLFVWLIAFVVRTRLKRLEIFE